MTNKKLMAFSDTSDTTITPVGLDFDGTNDYLSRSSDLVGNADSKTFTFSCWVYNTDSANAPYIYASLNGTATPRFRVELGATNGKLSIYGHSTAGVEVLYGELTTVDSIPSNTWFHLLISIDLTNTTKRHIYLNDTDITSNATWYTYTNTAIDFTGNNHVVMAERVDIIRVSKGRLAHVFLSYDYYDLSILANRRLFNQISTDRGLIPSDTVPANPILYLPMDDPDDQGRNDGIGGNFVVNGDPSRSERGSNQYNVVASEFDGVSDSITKSTALTGVSPSKVVTLSMDLKFTTANNAFQILSGTQNFYVSHLGSGQVIVVGRDAAGTNVLYFTITAPYIALGSNFKLSFSMDSTDVNKTVSYVNGKLCTITPVLVTVGGLFGITTGGWEIAKTSTNFQLVTVGCFYFDTSYIDLSTSNPFWDSDTNRPAYLGETGELPTGSSPLIYLPLRADDAGNNLGTGGDFVVNSGPFVGARGMSEFWSRSANFDGTTGYLSRGAKLTGIVDTKTVTLVVAINYSVAIDPFILSFPETAGQTTLEFRLSGDKFQMTGTGYNPEVLGSTVMSVNNSYIFMLSFDLTDVAKRFLYLNDIAETATWSTYTNTNIPLSTDGEDARVGAGGTISTPVTYMNGDIAHLYFSTDYIDFSIEDNRDIFVDRLGFPRDLQPAIDAGTIPNGLIRMNFNDPNNLGANDGDSGDFIVNGTVTSGSDVNV